MPEDRRGGRSDDRDRERDRNKKLDRDRDRDRRDRDSDKRKEKKSSKDENYRSSRNRDSKDEEEHGPIEDKPHESTEVLQERIAKMREARQKKKDGGVSDWVNKSRVLEKQKLQKPPMAKLIAEQDEDGEDEDAYSSRELAGMKVRHGLDQVMQGGEVILTLKDSRLIVGEELNEEPDELENVTLAEQKARKDAYEASKKKNALDEDRFQNDINSATTVMLPQYDDVIKDEGVVLDDTGGINEDTQAKVEEVRKKLLGLQGTMLKTDSLQGKTIAKDFYTEEEMLQFKKPKQKKKKLRKKDKLDIDAIEAEAKASGLGADDLGSRDANVKARQEAKLAEERSRLQAYNSAFAKATEASKSLRPNAADTDIVLDEEDELQRQLKKTREEALKKRLFLGPQGVAARLASMKNEPESMDVDAEERVTISETQEFCLSLQLDTGRHKTEKDESKPAEEDAEMSGDEQAGWMEDDNAPVPAPTPSKDEDDEPVNALPIREVTVGRGLAATLQLLHEKGSLKNGVEWGGRNMDKKASKLVGIVDDKDPDGDILLDRRDEYGRSMTPKEAFRRISHKFHGKGPGKTKQEKKMKQYNEEQKLKHMDPGSATEKMREIQAQTRTPYLVLTGHIKPGQTSDPRSGFATVEKESSVGGLTPMLGDRKVEHFLGFPKRKGSDMKPPHPKRRK